MLFLADTHLGKRLVLTANEASACFTFAAQRILREMYIHAMGGLRVSPTSLNNCSHYFDWSLGCLTVRCVIHLLAHSMLSPSQ